MVLATEMTTDTDAVRVIGFMPMRKGDLSAVVRIVIGLSGSVAMRAGLRLRFGYGAVPTWCENTSAGLSATIGSDHGRHDEAAAQFERVTPINAALGLSGPILNCASA